MFTRRAKTACVAALVGLVAAGAARADVILRPIVLILAPTNVKVAVVFSTYQPTSGSVLLRPSWKDNSIGETYYKVEFRKSPFEAWQTLATLPGNSTSAVFNVNFPENTSKPHPGAYGQIRVTAGNASRSATSAVFAFDANG